MAQFKRQSILGEAWDQQFTADMLCECRIHVQPQWTPLMTLQAV